VQATVMIVQHVSLSHKGPVCEGSPLPASHSFVSNSDRLFHLAARTDDALRDSVEEAEKSQRITVMDFVVMDGEFSYTRYNMLLRD
jgi:hypothetical protein